METRPERLDVYVQTANTPSSRRKIGTAMSHLNFGIVAMRCGLNPKSILDGKVRTHRGCKEWLLITYK